jgi:hypothetical protein
MKDDNTTKIAVIFEKVTKIEGKIDKMESRMDQEFVTRGELEAKLKLSDANNAVLKDNVETLKKIVYGVVSLILTAVVGGGLLFLINKP